MGFWTAAGIAGGSLLSGIGQWLAGNESADAVSDASRESAAVQRYMFDRSTQLSEPWRQTGVNALNEMNALMGLSQVNPDTPVNALGQPASAGDLDYASYVTDRPGLHNAFQTLRPEDTQYILSQGYDQNGDGTIDVGEFGRFNHNTSGQAAGWEVPTFGDSGTLTLDNPTTGEGGNTQDDAYQRFQNGGFARSMLETTEADMERMIGAFGAGGTAMSGSTLGALNDRNRRNTNTAFTQHWNALGGMSGTGGNVAQNQGQMGMSFANNIGNLNMQAANAQGSSYMNAANALGNTLQNGVNTYAYGRGEGWW